MTSNGKFHHPTSWKDSEGKTNHGFLSEEGTPKMESIDKKRTPGHIELDLGDSTRVASTSQRFSRKCDLENSEHELWGCRHTVVALSFLGMLVNYLSRVCFPIAIVAMVGTRAIKNENINKTLQEICPLPDDYSFQNGIGIKGDFDWDEETQGLALGAFYWGLMSTNLLGGRAADLFGGRLVFGLGVVLSSFLTIVTPFCAWHSKELLIAIRILSGVMQGVTYPALGTLLVRWIAPQDRSKFTSVVGSGCQIGTVVSMSISGLLIDSKFLGGWPASFYVLGALGCLWGIPWFLLIRDRYQDHPRVSQAEINYLSSIKEDVNSEETLPIPWREMATSLPLMSVIVAGSGFNFGFYLMLNGIPTYLANILHFDMKSNGLLSALPYLLMAITAVSWGTFVNYLTNKKIISILSVRRLSNGVGLYIAAIGLVTLSSAECDTILVVITLCGSVAIMGTTYSGFTSSYQDIAPNLAGTITGMSNTVGALQGIIAPIINGIITNGNQTPAAWRTSFLLTAGIMVVTATIYIVFVSDQVQPWSKAQKKEDISDSAKHWSKSQKKEESN